MMVETDFFFRKRKFLFLSALILTGICCWMTIIFHFQDAPSFERVWTPNLAFYSGYDVTFLRQKSQKMAEVLLGLEDSKFKSVYNKYQNKGKLCISKQVHNKFIFLLPVIFLLQMVLKFIMALRFLFKKNFLIISQVGLKYREILETIVDE